MGATSSTSWAPGIGALLAVAAGKALVAGPSFGLTGLGAASRRYRAAGGGLVGMIWCLNGDLMENHRKTHGKW
jgi:hypothetical protein